MDSKVKIIGYTKEPDRITASGARISTTAGDSLTIFENATDTAKNQDLVRKVYGFGHQSLIEHIYFNLAFINVSAYVEQFMLEFRLASFTVKSRRYVDFSKMGFTIPSFLDENGIPIEHAAEMEKAYTEHMSYLFEEYDSFVKQGIPKEDARFLLPYCYRSNFYCTLNARELVHVLQAMLFGRGKGLAEITSLGNDLLAQAAEACPFIFKDFSPTGIGFQDKFQQLSKILSIGAEEVPQHNSDTSVELLSYTQNPEQTVARAALIAYTNLSTGEIEGLLEDPKKLQEVVEFVLSNQRPRELEQIMFTFRINGITLAGITHLTRHRMQSILIPPFQDVCRCARYCVPDTVKADPALLGRFQTAYSKTAELHEVLRSKDLNKYELSYMYLSGNVIDITTTMNARELLTFIALRSCNRAQWEVRGISISMLNLLREAAPAIFSHYGPNCYVNGFCPEGRKSCGQFAQVQEWFGKK